MTRALALALALALSGGLLAIPQVALAAPREGEREEAPKADAKPEPIGTLSQQGTRRGALEIGVASLLTGTAIGLAAFGTIQFIRAREHVDFCNDALPGNSTGIDPCIFDPPPLGFAAAGLSWGFSVPLLVGAGLLFVRGAEVAMDAKRYRRTQASLSPWWNQRGGGASLRLRF